MPLRLDAFGRFDFEGVFFMSSSFGSIAPWAVFVNRTEWV